MQPIQQVQTTPPPSPQAYIQQQQQEVGSNSSGSPRRRKPPLDIDAALYLQSQAHYVQEPAVSQRRPPLPPAQLAGTVAGFNAPAQFASAACSPSKLPLGAAAARHQAAAANNCGNQNSFVSHSNFDFNFNNNNYNIGKYNANNISVDYIDCVTTASGDDDDGGGGGGGRSLSRPWGARQRPDAPAMRGHLFSCRKHLRFQRANRIEPKLGVASEEQVVAGAAPTSTSSTSSSSLINADDANHDNHHHHQRVFDGHQTAAMESQTANQMQAATTSALYPIPVCEVKKRTYFIGSVGQDSLIGHEELNKYFPNCRVNIFVCTWNQNRKRAPANLNDLLLPDQLVLMPDIYAIGIQEAFSSQTDYLREWEIELQTTLGPNHVLFHSCSLGTLHLSLFVRRDLIWFCSMPEESVYNSRSMPTNMIKTKGAVSIAFRFFGTSFMFTNCHFPAHENKLKDRIDEYQRIINSINLPKNLKLLKPRYLSNDSTARFDCVFFMGDLNFRLEQRSFDETVSILEDIFQQKEPSYEALTQNDELLRVMESNQAFHGFDESQIRFPPTFKFLAQTNKYDRQTKRVPSYTDRILFRSKRQRHIRCLIYDWLPQLLSSDHKPVYCLFDVLIRPGHEKNMVSSLNAGLFQRAIYLEALKRRSEDSDGLRENGAGGNLICSIS